MFIMRVLFCLIVPLLLTNCASIVEGTTDTLTVITDPAGANCNLKRQGATIGVVNPTPGSVTVSKSKYDISVLCKKDGHQDGADTFGSEFQGMTFGNILFGGIIGVAVDASSGAMHHYQDTISIPLQPISFPSISARDDFFDRERERINQHAQMAINRTREGCAGDQKVCSEKVVLIQSERDSQLGAVELRRLEAKVAN